MRTASRDQERESENKRQSGLPSSTKDFVDKKDYHDAENHPKQKASVGKTVDFGSRFVNSEEKPALVNEVFDGISDKYDLMNDLMSAGIHRLWKDEFVQILNPPAKLEHSVSGVRTPHAILDLAGGTGDIAVRILQRILKKNRELCCESDSKTESSGTRNDTTSAMGAFLDGAINLAKVLSNVPVSTQHPTSFAKEGEAGVSWSRNEDQEKRDDADLAHVRITICDPNTSMLAVGRDKVVSSHPALSGSLEWVRGAGEALPFSEEAFDSVVIAFGIRNFTDREKGLQEIYRVLKPGGRFLCLEFSHVEENKLVRSLYQAYSNAVIPTIGRTIVGDAEPYRYLVESIRKFPRAAEFADMLRQAGFCQVSATPMTWGVVAVHSGFKYS